MKPHLKAQWCLSKIDANFIWQMEKVLDTYEKSYNKKYPVLSFDERPY